MSIDWCEGVDVALGIKQWGSRGLILLYDPLHV